MISRYIVNAIIFETNRLPLVTTSVPVWKNVRVAKEKPVSLRSRTVPRAFGPRRPPSIQSRDSPFIYEQYFRNRYRFPVYFVFVSRSLRSTDKNETSLERYNSEGGKGLHRSAVKREATWNVAGLFLRGKRATRVKGWNNDEEDGNEEDEDENLSEHGKRESPRDGHRR